MTFNQRTSILTEEYAPDAEIDVMVSINVPGVGLIEDLDATAEAHYDTYEVPVGNEGFRTKQYLKLTRILLNEPVQFPGKNFNILPIGFCVYGSVGHKTDYATEKSIAYAQEALDQVQRD